MSSRRYFLVQTGMAAAALTCAKPFKAFGRNGSSLSFLGSDNRILIMHTHTLNEKTADIISGIKNNTNVDIVLLHAGKNNPCEDNDRFWTENTLKFHAALSSAYYFKDNAGLDLSTVADNDHSGRSLQSPIEAYKIIRSGGLKIGIITVTDQMNRNGVIYKNPVKLVSSLATQLKEQSRCNLVICLSGLGSKTKTTINNHTLARLSENVDIVIGQDPQKTKSQTTIVLNRNKEEVVINSSGKDGDLLGQIEICFDEKLKKNQIGFRNLSLQKKTV